MTVIAAGRRRPRRVRNISDPSWLKGRLVGPAGSASFTFTDPVLHLDVWLRGLVADRCMRAFQYQLCVPCRGGGTVMDGGGLCLDVTGLGCDGQRSPRPGEVQPGDQCDDERFPTPSAPAVFWFASHVVLPSVPGTAVSGVGFIFSHGS